MRPYKSCMMKCLYTRYSYNYVHQSNMFLLSRRTRAQPGQVALESCAGLRAPQELWGWEPWYR